MWRVGLSMNRPFGVPALACPDRLKAGLQTSGVPPDRFIVPMHSEKRKGALHEARISKPTTSTEADQDTMKRHNPSTFAVTLFRCLVLSLITAVESDAGAESEFTMRLEVD